MVQNEKAPNIKDLAVASGVSTATASRAMSRPEAVTEATRERVLAAATRIGYRVNIAARNLRKGETGVIVALVPSLENPFFTRVLAGIETTASAAELGVVVVDTAQPSFSNETALNYLDSSRFDGVVVLDGTIAPRVMEQIRALGNPTPCVFACEWIDHFHFPSVWVDNELAAQMAVRHLFDLGHKHIGHISGLSDNVISNIRVEGVKSELIACGVEVNTDWFYEGDFSIQSGAEAAQVWLTQDIRPTAVFCSSDRSAIGFISELSRHGIQTPNDVSVVGFDDVEIASWFIPPLTTIRQPKMDIGIKAATLLLEQIRGKSPSPESTILPVELTVRGSTRPQP